MQKTLWRGLVSAALALVLLLGVAALPLEGLLVDVFAAEPTPYIVVEDCDDKDAYTSCVEDFADKMQGAASVSTAIDGTKTVENTVSFKIDVTTDMLSGWYLECWLYVDKVNNLQLRDSTVGIYQTSSNKAEIALNKLSPAIKNGWNKIQVKLSNLTYTKKSDFNTLNRVYLNIKTTRNTVIKLDDVCLIAGTAAGDLSGLETAIEAGDALAATDLSGFDAANVAEFEAALAAAKTRLTGCSQRDVDVAATNLKNAMNAFGMEGYTVDDEALVAYIDFNTKTYKDIDRFAIRNADGSEGGLTAEPVADKYAAAVGGKLLLAVNDEYVSATDAKVRVTYTYYDGEAGSLTLGYNSADNAAATTQTVALGNTTFWKRESVKVADAAFTEAIDGRFDLQISLDGADVAYITRVEVKLVTDSDVTEKDPPKFPEMTDINNFENKSVAGYQMWFTASPGTSGWVHWAGGNIPSNDRISFEMWPDISEYPSSVLENTAFNNLGDGRPAQLFTSVKPETVDLHVSWMEEAGLDGFAIQRFYGKYNSGTERDYLNLVLARDAAEKYGRVFYVMYDMNGGLGDGNYAAEVLKSDFVRNVEQQGIIESTSYAQMDGKPVVCMWGIDPGSDSYTNHDATLEFICWLQDRGYYVVGGTSNNGWYNSNSFDDVYRQLDMISPWTVGRYSHNGVADWMRNSYTPTIAECEKYGIEFQPVVIAGGSWHNHNWGMPNDQPHLAGNFLWRQIYLLKNLYKAERVYFAMFDEYDEGTAIMKAAQDSYDIPEDEQYFLTLATDGTWLSSDFNLRLAGYICDIMRTEGDVGITQPVVHSEGPIYWRNSFEQRWTYVREEDKESTTGRKTVGVSLQSLDVGLPTKTPWKGDSVSLVSKTYECRTYVEYVEGNTDYKQYGTNTVGTGLHNDPGKTRTTNGTWSLQFNATAEATADDRFLIAQTDIMISAAGLEFSYDVLADNDLGKNVFMDLALEVDGEAKMLSDYVKDTTSTGAKTGSWVTKKVTVPASLVGQKVVGILVGYTGAAGDINAYLDNAVLGSAGTERDMLRTALKTAGGLTQTEELAAAIEAGQAIYDSAAATPKQRLKAMKAIDRVIRTMDLGAAADGMLGDVDDDGKITSTDARLVLQFYAGKITEASLNVALADVDGDGSITSTDARLILQKYAGKIEAFPAE